MAMRVTLWSMRRRASTLVHGLGRGSTQPGLDVARDLPRLRGSAPHGLPLLISLISMALGALGCDRPTGLRSTSGELVFVLPGPDGELRSREATLVLAPQAMRTAGSQQVTVRNIGDAPVGLKRLSKVSGSDALSMKAPAEATLGPLGETTLTVDFAPPQDPDAARPSAPHRARFRLDLEGARAGEDVATLEVEATAEAHDCLVPARLDFGLVPPGQQVALPFALDNTASLATTAQVGTLDGADAASFSVSDSGAVEVAAGQALNVEVGFRPTEAREYAASLVVQRSPGCPSGTVVLSGRGFAEAISWAPASLDFGRLPLQTPALRTVTVTNQSAVAVPVQALRVTGAGFSLEDAAPTVVPPRGTTSFRVGCSAPALGRLTGELAFDLGTDPPMHARVPLMCVGGGPRARLQPRALDFGPVAVTTTRTLHLSNVGTPPLPGDPGANLFLGHQGRPPFIEVTPLNVNTAAGTFYLAVPATYDPAAGIEATAGKNDLPLELRLTPSALGPLLADVAIFTTDSLEPSLRVRVSATGVAATHCHLQVSPQQLQFGDLPPGARLTQNVVVTNLSSSAADRCLVAGVELTANSNPGFSLRVAAGLSATIAGGQHLLLPVEVAIPPLAAPGDRLTGFLRFSTSSDTLPQVVVPVGARAAECLVMIPSSVDFGTVRPGCRSASRALSLYNVCAAPIAVGSYAVNGGGFGWVSSPVIPAGGLVVQPSAAPVSVSVAWTPAQAGPGVGAVSVAFDVAGQARHLEVPLSGLASDVSLQEDAFDIPTRPASDILLTVDNSCSMSDKQQHLATNFSSFIAYANQQTVDYQIGVTTTDDTPWGEQGLLLGDASNPAILSRSTGNVAAMFAQKVNVGTRGAGVEQPLAASLHALTPPLSTGANAGLVRPDATLAVVVVSDAQDQSPNPLAYYLDRLLAVKGPATAWQFSFNVIGPFTWPLPVGCTIDDAPDDGRYQALIDGTHGVKADICSPNWAADLERVGSAVFGLRSVFPLKLSPEPGQPPVVLINGAAHTNWTWDPVTNAITFPPSSAPGPGSHVVIRYTPACY